ncbi:MAG: hypothetical protein V7K64_24145 [Nostoc sp.]|uniref:hypothetical protein n=1 Tax=unclassified Nostoc TaxID=2593658 RepID=UPI001DEEDEAA|nr:hypothetical protein [Nostoc sp. JL34]MBN3885469.1 hypothetical protein [Nostoc sp. JL34]
MKKPPLSEQAWKLPDTLMRTRTRWRSLFVFARLRYPLKRFTPLATMGRMCWLPNALPRLH